MGNCPVCSKTVFRPGMQSCLDWCKHAKECVGAEKLAQYTRMKGLLRKKALAAAMEGYFGSDFKRIKHARRTAEYAEMILTAEGDADPNVVIAAAYLHDIGIKNAEAKHGSAEGVYQELEGPPVAREILKKLDYPENFIKEVCDIIGHHHHPGADETINFRVLYDADQLVNAEESGVDLSGGDGKRIASGLMTKAGMKLASGEGNVGGQQKD